MQDGRKAVWSIPYVSVAFFPSLKQNCIAYRCSKVSSRPDYIFEIPQLWQSGFSRVYSNSGCSCSFEAEIIKIGQSSHKMYSNKLLNFQESITILNAYTKKVWKLIVCSRKYEKTAFSYLLIIKILGKERTRGDNPNNSIAKIGQNIEKSPGNLRRLGVIQTPGKNHQLTPVWKTHKRVKE